MGKRKWFAAALALCMIMAFAVAAYAYLSNSSGLVDNQFGAATDPTVSIQETLNDPLTKKENVRVDVGNPGYAVYVRAAIVITWEDNSGNILAQKPISGTDYSIELNVGSDKQWFEKDGFYYFRSRINSGTTEPLIVSCEQLAAAPAGYQLHVEIVAQTIQALGTTDVGDVPAVMDAWKITVNPDGTLADR